MDGKRRLRPEERSIPRGVTAYICVHGLLVVPALVGLIYLGPEWSPVGQVGVGLYLIAGLLAGGGLLEAKRWAVPLEVARNLAAIPLFASIFDGPLALFVLAGVCLAACALLLARPVRAAGERLAQRAPEPS